MDRERKVSYQVIAQGQLAGISLCAPSLQRLFIDSALAMSDYRISQDLVKVTLQKKVTVKGASLEILTVEWLNAVAALFNKEAFLPYRIVFTAFDGKRIEAPLSGETYESHRHGYPRPFQCIPMGSL